MKKYRKRRRTKRRRTKRRRTKRRRIKRRRTRRQRRGGVVTGGVAKAKKPMQLGPVGSALAQEWTPARGARDELRRAREWTPAGGFTQAQLNALGVAETCPFHGEPQAHSKNDCPMVKAASNLGKPQVLKRATTRIQALARGRAARRRAGRSTREFLRERRERMKAAQLAHKNMQSFATRGYINKHL